MLLCGACRTTCTQKKQKIKKLGICSFPQPSALSHDKLYSFSKYSAVELKNTLGTPKGAHRLHIDQPHASPLSIESYMNTGHGLLLEIGQSSPHFDLLRNTHYCSDLLWRTINMNH